MHEGCGMLDLLVRKGKSTATDAVLKGLAHEAVEPFQRTVSVEVVVASRAPCKETFVEEFPTKHDHLIQ